MHPLSRLSRGYARFAAMAPGLKPPRAYWNWLRANLAMRRGNGTLSTRPLKLTIDPYSACQLRCPLCPTGLRIQDRAAAKLGVEAFARLLDEVGDYLFFIDLFNWGEPLLNPELPELLRVAHRKGISTTLSSNLSLRLSDERIDRLVTSGLNELIVSVDGITQETYSTYRRRGEFKLAFENMRRIVAAKRRLGRRSPYVIWRMLVFSFNEHELPRAQELAREIGVDRFMHLPAYLDSSRFPMDDDLRSQIAGWAPADPSLRRPGPPPPTPAAGRERRQRTRCDWHYVSAAVNADGTVAPCCTVWKTEDDFGALNQGGRGGFMDIWNGPAFSAVRNRFAGRAEGPTGLVCDDCPTPDIMDYAGSVNRSIALLSCIQALEAGRRGLRRLAGRPSAG